MDPLLKPNHLSRSISQPPPSQTRPYHLLFYESYSEMSDNVNEKEKGYGSSGAQEPSMDDVEQSRKRLRIRPVSGWTASLSCQDSKRLITFLTQRKVFEFFSHLRIDSARIKPINGQVPKIGGNADVEAAILASDQLSSSSESDITEYVAVRSFASTQRQMTTEPLRRVLPSVPFTSMERSEKIPFAFQGIRS